MNVGLFITDRNGAGLYRMYQPGRAVARVGHEVVLASGLWDNQPFGPLDVLVFQRPLHTDVEPQRRAQAAGVAVVVEFDDEFELWPEAHEHYGWDPRLAQSWVRTLRRACATADWVTVSTPALARYATHGRVSVIPNRMPRAAFDIPRPAHDGVRVGWCGNSYLRPWDMSVAGDGVRRALDETGASFRVVGHGGERLRAGLQLDEVPKETELVFPATYYMREVARLDVAIIPLADNAMNRARSWSKGLEMAACGVPFVASPLPEYVRLAEEYGIGVIASTPRDWRRELVRLIRDPDRAAIRDRMRNAALTTDAAPWIDAWQSAIDHRRSAC